MMNEKESFQNSLIIQMRAQQLCDNRKKKGKKGTNVPLSELGFKAKIYYGIQTEYTRRRVKYKAARYGVQNSKECFMGRLTFVLDANALTHDELDALPNFKAIKKHEWEKVKQIIYHSREELACAICLEKQFRAPQMTHCGHVFCWHCIYMHHYRSLKANNCPVCNEIYSIEHVVTCKPIYGRSFAELQQNKIKLALKCHIEGDKKIYDTVDFREDLNFARVVKATTEKIVSLYQAEKEEIQKFYHECEQEQTKGWVAKIISLSYDKVEKAGHHLFKRDYKPHRNETKIDGYFLSNLEERSNIVTFYQQHSGKFIFLHPLCDKFLRNCKKELPPIIEQQIVGWQQVQYNLDLARRYKQLHHIIINQEIDLVIINLHKFLSQEEHKQFQTELEQCKIRKQEEIEREERESERLQVKYEQEKEYLKKLKKMEESEFYDIRVPTTINLNELGDNAYFPSLIQTKSQPDPSLPLIIEPPKEKDKKKEPVVLNEGDFPGLIQPKPPAEQTEDPPKLFFSKSEEPKLTTAFQEEAEFPVFGGNSSKKNEDGPKFQKKNSRKKKQKFVNVTDQFFQRKEQEDN